MSWDLDVKGLRELLEQPRKILITTHHKADGDAIGSSLALYNYFIQKGHAVSVVTPDDFPEFLSWMAGADKIIDFEKEISKSEVLADEAEVIFCLDFNMLNRLNGFAPFVEKSTAVKVLIDHHLYPHNFCKYIYSFPESCATSEIVYKFICALGDKKFVNKNVAECLYAGIMTDTASFRFETMMPETHRIIADLMEAGAENYKIHEAVFDTNSEERMRFLGYCLKDKLTVLHEYNTAYISVSAEELKRYGNKTGDTEGVVNYALAVNEVRFAVLFIERKNTVKLSLRSKNDFSVRDFASKHFNGGGHKNAAGGNSDLTLEKTVKKFLELLPQYKQVLTGN